MLKKKEAPLLTKPWGADPTDNHHGLFLPAEEGGGAESVAWDSPAFIGECALSPEH